MEGASGERGKRDDTEGSTREPFGWDKCDRCEGILDYVETVSINKRDPWKFERRWSRRFLQECFVNIDRRKVL